MLTTRSEIVQVKRYAPRRRIRRYPFQQCLFVRYTFLVLPLHLLSGFILCYTILCYFASFYYSERMQVYTRNINSRLNDVIPMAVAIITVKLLQPLRMRFLFMVSELLVRSEHKYVEPVIAKLAAFKQRFTKYFKASQ